jgi:antitoxin component of MazEF toxin-antitoxin module
MEYKTTQKVIKIGSSIGVTIPAKEARHLGVKVGDTVTLSMRRNKGGWVLRLIKRPFRLFGL